jgi:hypothetical protein
MQHAVEHSEHSGGNPMHIRIGFHYGDVIQEAADVFGDTVNIAARVAAITRASQIMTTQAVIDTLPAELIDKTRRLMRAELKGKQEQIEIFLVIWERDEMMSTRIGIPAYRKSPENIDELLLSYRDQKLTVNKERRSVLLGRGDTCDIVVHNEFASRQHLRIELRQGGKFIITDQSTNGTFLHLNNGNTVRLAREEMILQGNGHISLGHLLTENQIELVEFAIHSVHHPH